MASENCRHVDALPLLMENLGRNLEVCTGDNLPGCLIFTGNIRWSLTVR